jgi:mono/diheme cytochrome c family protein
MKKGAKKIIGTLLIVLICGVGLYFSHTFIYKAGVTAGRLAAMTEFANQKPVEPDLRVLARDTNLASKGQALFKTNCTRCHGDNGEGNGPQSAGLNPPPRNYRKETFKFGNDIVSIFNTLRNGSPGTSMPSFSLLPMEDLFALAHYVRTLVPNPTPTTDEIIAQLPASGGMGEVAAQGPRIPIQFAMQRLEISAAAPASVKPVDWSHPGAAVYSRNCAACHGRNGEGQTIDWISVNPYVYESTVSLANKRADWYADRKKFASIVTVGLPGRVMPGNAELTEAEIDNLYDFVKGFAD